jgi:phage terminase large subunit GpA-like protein
MTALQSSVMSLYEVSVRIAEPRPGYIHFPAEDGFGPEYFEQLTSERRETRRRMGQSYTVWVLPPGKRNEVLDTFVGALAVRRSLPRRVEAGLEYQSASDGEPVPVEPPARPPAPAQAAPPNRMFPPQHSGFLERRTGFLSR